MGQGVTVDYMHGVLEGVTKLLLGLWVEIPQYCLWSVPAKVIDQRLGAILVPDVINPLPRGVSDRKHWKGKFLIHACSLFILSAGLHLVQYVSTFN